MTGDVDQVEAVPVEAPRDVVTVQLEQQAVTHKSKPEAVPIDAQLQKMEEEEQIDIHIQKKEGGCVVKENIEGGEKKNKKAEKKLDLIASIAISSDVLIESIFSDILEEVVREKVREKVETSILCDLAIEKNISHVFEDIYTEGIKNKLMHVAEKEKRIDIIGDLVVDSVLDNIIDATSSDVGEKMRAVRHLFSEPSPSHFTSPPSTPANVVVQ